MFHPKCISAALFYSVISSNNLFPPPQKKKQKSQQLVPAGKVFGLLGFLLFFLATPFYTLPRLVFRGRKHCTVRFVFKKFGD
ncbi:hypothetical protein CGI45_01035 [Vibrio parahaemolyticus]|nr:hypothetical protein CGI45_01035 [Vibrio parahaemolyticus]